MELNVLGRNILFNVVKENPFRKKEEDGILIATADELNAINASDKENNGKVNELEQMIGLGVITKVGPDCKLKEGDFIYFMRGTLLAVPYYDNGSEVQFRIHEEQVLAYVREK